MREFLRQTMVAERLCGVGAYVAMLFIACVALNGTTTRRGRRLVLGLYLLAITTLSFFFVPDSSKDLYRWLELSKDWTSLPIDVFFQDIVMPSNTPAAYLMIYLCRLTGLDGILPATCALIFYFNAFYIIDDSSDRYDLSGKDTSLVLLYLMCSGTLLEVISGVRCLVAFSLVANGAYREIIEGKSMLFSLPLYLFASLLHLAAVVLVAIRLVSLVLLEKKDDRNLFLNLIIIAIIMYLAITRGGSILAASLAKAESYLTVKHYSYFWEQLNGLFKYGLVMFVFIQYRKQAVHNTSTDNITKLSLSIWLIGAVGFFEYSIFHRFMVPMMMLAVPALSLLLKECDNKRDTGFKSLVRSMSILILVLACVRGDLSGFKFFLIG